MPRNRGPRKRIARGIYRDLFGYECFVAVGSGPRRRAKTRRFPFGTAPRTMTAWQTQARAALLATQPARRVGLTLDAAITAYLPTIATRACAEARGYELAAWAAVFGDRPLTALAAPDLQAQLEQWAADGVAASTLNHRITSLLALYATHPTLLAPSLRRYREPDPEPRALTYVDVEQILAAMPASATRARLRVMAYTGLPPVRLARLRPTDVDLDHARVWLQGRRKGKGTKARAMPLTTLGVEAFKEFVQVGAWGRGSSSGMSVSFARAVQKVNAQRAAKREPLLVDVRPYDFRHTFGSWAYAQTRDLHAVAQLLDVTTDTALRYALASVAPNVQAIVDGLNGQTPRSVTLRTRQKGRRGTASQAS